MSHTPGPWEVWGDSGYVRWPDCKNRAGKRTQSVVCSISLPGANDLFCMTGGYGDYETSKKIQAANARLIAAAPDFLVACTNLPSSDLPEFLEWVADRLVMIHEESPSVDYVLTLRDRAEKIRAAIAKAGA